MNLLLDTYVLLWWLDDPTLLSELMSNNRISVLLQTSSVTENIR